MPDARGRRILARLPRARFALRVRVTATRAGAPSRNVTMTVRVRSYHVTLHDRA